MRFLPVIVRSPLTHAALLLVAVGALYAPSIGYSFNFDDESNFVDNYAVKHPSYLFAGYDESQRAGIGDTMYHHYRVRMIPYLSFAANYAAGGFAHPWHWRAVNVALHALMSVLVYCMVRLLMRMPRLVGAYAEDRIIIASLGSGLLFACHPLMTETVVYVSGRVGEIAAFFYVAAVVFYLAWCVRGSRLAYSAAIISGVLAMFSKETAFTLPFMLVLIEWLFGALRERWKGLAPFLAMLTIIPATKLIVLYNSGIGISSAIKESSRLLTDTPRSHYLLTQTTVLVRYLKLFVWPAGQNGDYYWPLMRSIADSRVIASSAILLAVAVAGVWALKRSGDSPVLRITALGVFGFFIALSVESSIFPIIVPIAEYRTYLPSAFVIPGIVAGMMWAYDSATGAKNPARLLALIAVIALALSIAAFERSKAWENYITFWTDVSLKSPSSSRAVNNLGTSYLKIGRYDEAAKCFEEALRINPRYPEALTNMGAILQMRGENAAAADYFIKSIEIYPYSFRTHFDLGLVLQNLGRHEEALTYYANAIALMPDFADAYLNMGIVNMRLKRFDTALQHLRRALQLRPYYMQADLNIALAYKGLGRLGEAEQYARALKIKYPEFYPVSVELGWMLLGNGKPDEAQSEFEHVLSMERNNSDALEGLKEIARRKGETRR